jgi:hypothetical protein
MHPAAPCHRFLFTRESRRAESSAFQHCRRKDAECSALFQLTLLIDKSIAVQVYQTSNYEARKAAVADFNAANRFRKRGIAIIPTKFGISFTTKFLNQVRRSIVQLVCWACQPVA